MEWKRTYANECNWSLALCRRERQRYFTSFLLQTDRYIRNRSSGNGRSHRHDRRIRITIHEAFADLDRRDFLRPQRICTFLFLSFFFLSQHQGNSYYCVASKILVGVFLCVFARVSLKPSISRVFSTSVSTFRRSFERGHGSSRDDGQQRRRWNSIRSEQLLALLSLLPSRCTSRESLRSKRRLPQVGNRGIPHN